MTIRYNEAEVAEYLARFYGKATPTPKTDPSLSTSYAQPTKRARVKGSDVGKAVHKRYRVHVHSKRRRRTDSDGVSIKSAIDGLVQGQLLGDDSPDWIPQTPTQSQEKSDTEETILEVWEIE
jgi:hypothetical protein